MTDVTQIKAADLQRIGVSKPYAHQLVAGDRTPSLKLANKIHEALGIPTTAWPLSRPANDTPATASAA